MKYSIVKLTKQRIFEMCKTRTVEEAFDMLKQWMDYEPDSAFEMIEIA
jgi:hypothetical protein